MRENISRVGLYHHHHQSTSVINKAKLSMSTKTENVQIWKYLWNYYCTEFDCTGVIKKCSDCTWILCQIQLELQHDSSMRSNFIKLKHRKLTRNNVIRILFTRVHFSCFTNKKTELPHSTFNLDIGWFLLLLQHWNWSFNDSFGFPSDKWRGIAKL